MTTFPPPWKFKVIDKVARALHGTEPPALWQPSALSALILPNDGMTAQLCTPKMTGISYVLSSNLDLLLRLDSSFGPTHYASSPERAVIGRAVTRDLAAKYQLFNSED